MLILMAIIPAHLPTLSVAAVVVARRWQGEEIVVKVLNVRDWTTRKSRDFNEEHPKLR